MKRLLLGLSLACIAGTASAQIFYHDIKPDTTVGGGEALGFFAVRPPSMCEFDIFWRPVSAADPYITVAVHGPFGNGAIVQSGAYPAKLNSGTAINASSTWKESMDDTLSAVGGLGNWATAAADKYLGFRFKGATVGSWHYGWIRLTVHPDADSFTIKGWAYNTTVNAPINAGETGTTGINESHGSRQISLVSGPGELAFLDLPQQGFYPVEISDINGRIILQTSVRHSDRIGISDFAPGIYLVQIIVDGIPYRFKTAW